MKVYVFPADEAGCGHYRLIWPARILEQTYGDQIVVVPPRSPDELLQAGPKLRTHHPFAPSRPQDQQDRLAHLVLQAAHRDPTPGVHAQVLDTLQARRAA